MPNVYTNHKAKLANTSLTTIYTVPTAKTAIIKSIRVANEDTSNDCNITVTLVDTGSVIYMLEKDRTIQAKRSQELLATFFHHSYRLVSVSFSYSSHSFSYTSDISNTLMIILKSFAFSA